MSSGYRYIETMKITSLAVAGIIAVASRSVAAAASSSDLHRALQSPPLGSNAAERELQCNVCCDEYNAVVTCVNYQTSILFNPSVGGCATCIDGLIKSGSNCNDVLLETCSGVDSCLCDSSCKLFTDEYLKCMKGIDCASNTCTGSAAPGPTPVDNPTPSLPDGCDSIDNLMTGKCGDWPIIENGGAEYRFSYESMCINGFNIKNLVGTTREACALACVEYGEECLAIEYFTEDAEQWKEGDCNLSSSTTPNGCDNGLYKVDFYERSDEIDDATGTTASIKVPKGGICTEDSDCVDNGACARAEAISTADFVCCESGEKDRYSLSFGFVCTELPLGAYCKGIESFCTSGYCDDDGKCAVDTRECSEDEDCGDGGACGLEEVSTDAERVCCPSGSRSLVVMNTGFGSPKYLSVCDDLPVGAACYTNNAICASGVCGMDNVCVEEKIESGSPCRRYKSWDDSSSEHGDGMCASGACGQEEAQWQAPYVCCAQGATKKWIGISGYACTNLPKGAACKKDNSLCLSGVCGMDGQCAAGKVESGGLCREDEDYMCMSGACAHPPDSYRDEVCCSTADKIWNGWSYQCAEIPDQPPTTSEPPDGEGTTEFGTDKTVVRDAIAPTEEPTATTISATNAPTTVWGATASKPTEEPTSTTISATNEATDPSESFTNANSQPESSRAYFPRDLQHALTAVGAFSLLLLF